MENSEYVKVYGGNFILANRVIAELQSVGIVPIIKDESESQRLAGYASLDGGHQDVVVRRDELEKATEIVNRVKAEMEA
ncbi:hypothetical protein BTO05_03960 [Winogradskyella sp. PC-19]|uniref:putative signal transducing protein n=1 Tax=unclassified Winogradskyella TaxID=2615021 RepID=UPI000B3CAC72|nr:MULTISPECIES: DUF2007 domain-containing protein [unclassified Winogradskyella]ARV08834.1 hypothetical protein BTO05_03960 [Winogradskyella sp. PC-19]RZN76719.1 MAG: DUF2007 domain-containing protein [Winogradskyella sp.]